MTNQDVKEKFMERPNARARAKNLSCRDGSLWSFDWYELARWVDNEIIIRRGGCYSVTTAKHKAGIWGRLATNYTDRDSPRMEI